MRVCHNCDNTKHYALGLCQACYLRAWRAVTPDSLKYQKKWKKKNLAKGLCAQCINKRAKDSVRFCEYHLEQARGYYWRNKNN